MTTWVVWEFLHNPDNIQALDKGLARNNIRMVLQRDKEGNCKDIMYIDFKNKCIFSGDELDKRANTIAIQKIIDKQRLLETQQPQQTQRRAHRLRHSF